MKTNVAATILILAVALAMTPALYAAQVRQFTATITPTEVCAGDTDEVFTITITNSASSTKDLGSAEILVPSAFTSVTGLSATNSWVAALVGGVITLKPPAPEGNNKLAAGSSISVTFSAAAPTTLDSYEWTVSGFQGTTWDEDNFQISGSQPAVTVILCGEGTYETAWAYGGVEMATCFLDILGLNANRWGWTNGPLAPLDEDADPYVFELWAAAGQCDTEKGVLVGALIVEYDGATATVTYDMASGYTLAQVHLYVGNGILPLDKKGDATVAPGQFPYGDDEVSASVEEEYPITIASLSGDIYVIAHAVVYGDLGEAEE